MNTLTYDYIWNEVIYKEIKKLEKKYAHIKSQYDLKYRDLNKLKLSILQDYNKVKNILKKSYYNISDFKKNKELQNRIDNHKIAACLCYSVIKNKVFSFNVKPDMPTDIFVINYTLAYSISLSFIYAMLVAQYIKNNQQYFAKKLLEIGTLKVPPTTMNHDEYNIGRIYTLALNDIYGNTFDILTYSDMMFWIELYNRQLLENTLLPMQFEINAD